MNEDVRVVDDGFHRLGAGDEVRRDIAAIELHALDEVGFELEALALLDRDDAVLADLVHHVRDQLTDFAVLGADGCHGRDLFLGADVVGHVADGLRYLLRGRVDAALEQHWVGARGDVLQTFIHDRLGQDGGGGGPVARDVVGLGRGFLQKLRAHILVRVFQLDFLRHGHAVVGDCGSTELLVDGDVAALRTERSRNGVRQRVNANLQTAARIFAKSELLSHI